MIRPARIEDAEVIAALTGELGYPTSPERGRLRLAALLDRGGAAVFVAELEGSVVGWIHVVGCVRLEEDAFAEIGGLVVAEDRRGAGIGAGLVDAAERWARDGGYARMLVRSNVLRERAHRFYERVGYTCFKRQKVFSRQL